MSYVMKCNMTWHVTWQTWHDMPIVKSLLLTISQLFSYNIYIHYTYYMTWHIMWHDTHDMTCDMTNMTCDIKDMTCDMFCNMTTLDRTCLTQIKEQLCPNTIFPHRLVSIPPETDVGASARGTTKIKSSVSSWAVWF